MIVLGPDFRVPPQLGVLQLIFLLLVVEAIKRDIAEYGPAVYTLTSWYRDPMRNAMVGGVEGSLHTVGLAMDVVRSEGRSIVEAAACGVGSLFGLCKERKLFALENAFRRLAPPFTQAVLERDHSHWELDLA